jgi:hypothetical protein
MDLIPLKRVARSLDLDPSTIAKMEARGDFVKSVNLGVRKKVYPLAALEVWWRERLGGQSGVPFPLAPEPAPARDDETFHASVRKIIEGVTELGTAFHDMQDTVDELRKLIKRKAHQSCD